MVLLGVCVSVDYRGDGIMSDAGGGGGGGEDEGVTTANVTASPAGERRRGQDRHKACSAEYYKR